MTSQPQPTTAQQPQAPEPDIQERIEGFNKELLPILGKFELGLAGIVQLTPDGRLQAQPVIVSVRGRTDVPQMQPGVAPDAGLSKVE
jgi:hypothetical protein